MNVWPRYLFPPKAHPEDNDAIFDVVAKLCFLSSVAILLYVLSCFYVLFVSQAWPSVTGRMDSIGLIKLGKGMPTRSWTYYYTVDGTEYESDRAAIGGQPFNVDQFEGAVRVYYDPEDPGSSLLSRSFASIVYFYMLAGIFLPFIGRWVWVHYV